MNILMPEPISIGSSIGSILSIAVMVVRFVRGLATVPGYVQQIQKEAELFRRTVIHLRNSILKNEQRNPDALRTILDNLADLLEACMKTFQSLERSLDRVTKENAAIADRAKWKWREDEWKNLLRSLESHKGTLNIILGVLKYHQGQQILQTLNIIMDGSIHGPLPLPPANPPTNPRTGTSSDLPLPFIEIEGEWDGYDTEKNSPQQEPESTLDYEDTLRKSQVYKRSSGAHSSGQSILSYKSRSRRRGYSLVERMKIAGPVAAFSKKRLNEALLSAASVRDVREMSRLVEIGADVNYSKVSSVHYEISKMLEIGTNDYSEVSLRYYLITTPLFEACFHGRHLPVENRLESIQFLLDHGADADAKLLFDNSYFHYILSLDFPNLQEKLDIMDMLLKYEANINTRERDGWTPLRFAAWKNLTTPCLREIQFLLSRGANPAIKDKRGNSCESILKDAGLRIQLKSDGDKNCLDDWLLVPCSDIE